MRLAILLMTLMLPGLASAEGPVIEWKENRYNPKPAGDDLILPMPCGGAMAFRRVVTPYAEGAMGDLGIEIGDEAGEYGYLRGRRRAYVAGPFPGDDGFTAFYMAKYEVAEAQYDVVMADECPEKKPRRKDFVARSGVTWFDAVRFTERYSVWLAQTAPDAAPRAGDTASYLRLPTEAEWEFAARGGAVVSPAEFREQIYPLDGDSLAEREAFGSTTSANGKVQPIGSLGANPLGLHDMLGNVAELTIDPFQLIRQGRQHGRAGGFVKRGGSANTDESRIASAARQEVRFFDPSTGQPVTDKYLGFRPVLTAIAIDSAASEAAYAEAARKAASPDLQTDIGEEEAKALAKLESAASLPNESERRNALLEIARTLDAARAERNLQRNRAIESLFLAAASSCATVIQQIRSLNVLHRREEDSRGVLEPVREMKKRGELGAEHLEELSRAEEAYATILARIEDIETRISGYLNTYSEFISGLQKDYGPDVTDPQADLLRRKMRQGAPRHFGGCVGLATSHLSSARESGRLDLAKWREDITSIDR